MMTMSAHSSPLSPAHTSYSRHLKDLSVFLEYKAVRRKAGGGLYVLPDLNVLRLWHGVLFVRQGLYRGGIFKFRIILPDDYPEDGVPPRIEFSSKIYHPLVNFKSGELQLRAKFPEWNTKKHHIAGAVKFLKEIFFYSDFATPIPLNQDAASLWTSDPEKFRTHAEQCVALSIKRHLDADEESSIMFSEPKPMHKAIRSKILNPEGGRKLNVLDLVTRGVNVSDD